MNKHTSTLAKPVNSYFFTKGFPEFQVHLGNISLDRLLKTNSIFNLKMTKQIYKAMALELGMSAPAVVK